MFISPPLLSLSPIGPTPFGLGPLGKALAAADDTNSLLAWSRRSNVMPVLAGGRHGNLAVLVDGVTGGLKVAGIDTVLYTAQVVDHGPIRDGRNKGLVR